MSKLLSFFFFVVPLSTIALCILWILSGVVFLQSYSDSISIFLFTILPLIILIAASFFLLKVFRNIQQYKKPFLINQKWKAALYIGSFIFLLAICVFILFVTDSFINEKPPQLFPLNDPQAIYTITGQEGRFMIHYQTSSTLNKSYACSYPYGENPVCGDELNNDVEVMIGDSPLDLQKFVNRKVKVDGNFVYRTDQSIAGKCTVIGNSAALDIYSIDIVD